MMTFYESLHEGYGQTFAVKQVLFEHKTEHQHLFVFESERFGRVMVLDGIVQTTEADEAFYHEMLVHVPLFAHGQVKNVLIIGGGDGGSLREVLKHKDIEHVTLVEIDGQVIDICRRYLPHHSLGAFDDPRLKLVIGDGLDFVQTSSRQFDVIISDCTDDIGPGSALFSEAFYKGCQQSLNEKGIFVAQNGVPFFQVDELKQTASRLKQCFAFSTFYGVPVPSYVGGFMALAWATGCSEVSTIDVATLSRRFQLSGIATTYYNAKVHQAAFALPQYIQGYCQ